MIFTQKIRPAMISTISHYCDSELFMLLRVDMVKSIVVPRLGRGPVDCCCNKEPLNSRKYTNLNFKDIIVFLAVMPHCYGAPPGLLKTDLRFRASWSLRKRQCLPTAVSLVALPQQFVPFKGCLQDCWYPNPQCHVSLYQSDPANSTSTLIEEQTVCIHIRTSSSWVLGHSTSRRIQ